MPLRWEVGDRCAAYVRGKWRIAWVAELDSRGVWVSLDNLPPPVSRWYLVRHEDLDLLPNRPEAMAE